MTFTRRVMVADFDSVKQKELWQRVGPVEADRRLTAILRLACLLEGRLILTDSQLLDGIYFVSHGPDDVAALLGCNPWRIPFTIGIDARFPSLRDSLHAKLSNPAFEWSSQQIASGASDDERRRILAVHERRRAEWLAAVDAGRLDTSRFDSFSPEVLERHWDATPWPVPPDAGSAPPRSLAAVGLAGCTARSRARELITATVGPLSEPLPRLVYARWDAAYQQALATCNDASWLSFSRDAAPRVNSHLGAVRLDGTLLDQLADLDGTVNALVTYRAREAVEKWRRNPSRATAHEISYSVTDTLQPTPSRQAVFRGAAVRLLTPVLLSLAVLLVTLGGPRTSDWAPMAAVFGFVAAIPWAELLTALSARKGRLQAVIRVEPQ